MGGKRGLGRAITSLWRWVPFELRSWNWDGTMVRRELPRGWRGAKHSDWDKRAAVTARPAFSERICFKRVTRLLQEG